MTFNVTPAEVIYNIMAWITPPIADTCPIFN